MVAWASLTSTCVGAAVEEASDRRIDVRVEHAPAPLPLLRSRLDVGRPGDAGRALHVGGDKDLHVALPARGTATTDRRSRVQAGVLLHRAAELAESAARRPAQSGGQRAAGLEQAAGRLDAARRAGRGGISAIRAGLLDAAQHRDRGQQALGVRMHGVLDDRVGAAVLDHRAAVDDVQLAAVADVAGGGHVVGDEQHRHAEPDPRRSRSSCRMPSRSETSIIDTASSATRTSGSTVRARAITTRWRMPPDSMCG